MSLKTNLSESSHFELDHDTVRLNTVFRDCITAHGRPETTLKLEFA